MGKRAKNKQKGQKAFKDWFAVECLTNTGLRVAELADLRCGDIVIRDELSCVHVRNGKCKKQRDIMINREFQKEAMAYIKWKEVTGEPVGPNDVLLYSPKSKGKYSTRAIEGWFKRWIKEINSNLKHSIHHLRHTYATMLYKSSKNNLILVQNQLGHSSPEITQVYARVYKDEIADAVEKLF
jgi:integrase/recombinase XerD